MLRNRKLCVKEPGDGNAKGIAGRDEVDNLDDDDPNVETIKTRQLCHIQSTPAKNNGTFLIN